MAERKPSDDLKDGLFLLFKAARGAAKEFDTTRIEKSIGSQAKKVEKTVESGVRELGRVIGNVGKTLGNELEKTFSDRDSPPDAPRPPHEDETPRKPGA